MQEYNQDIIIEQIVAFLDGRASKDEALSLQAWVAQSEQHRTYFSQIRNIYEMSGRQLDPSVIRTDTAMQKVFRKIAPEGIFLWIATNNEEEEIAIIKKLLHWK